MKKSEALENHICRFNDGDQSCKCFMAGQEAGKREAFAIIPNPSYSQDEVDRLITIAKQEARDEQLD